MKSIITRNQYYKYTHSKIDSIYTILIALLPLLNHIPTPLLESFTLGNTALIITIPYVLLKVSVKKDISIKHSFDWLLLFCVYSILSFLLAKLVGKSMYETDSGWGVIFFTVSFLVIHVIFGNNSVFDLILARKVIEIVTVLACVSIIIQYMGHYIFNDFIQMVPMKIYTHEIQIAYENVARTGITNGLFRPSAFFLEPAHFAQYAIIGLLSLQYPQWAKKTNIFLCMFVTMGILMTTSGIGVVCTLLAWLMYFLYKQPKKIYNTVIMKAVVGLIAVIIVVIILYQFDFFKLTIDRIFTKDISKNPISRISTISYYNELSIFQKIFGAGFGLEPSDVYFTGGVVTLYRIGIVGSLLFYFVIINRYLHANIFCKRVCIIFIALYISGAMYSFVPLIFYFFLIFTEYRNVKRYNNQEEFVIE